MLKLLPSCLRTQFCLFAFGAPSTLAQGGGRGHCDPMLEVVRWFGKRASCLLFNFSFTIKWKRFKTKISFMKLNIDLVNDFAIFWDWLLLNCHLLFRVSPKFWKIKSKRLKAMFLYWLCCKQCHSLHNNIILSFTFKRKKKDFLLF